MQAAWCDSAFSLLISSPEAAHARSQDWHSGGHRRLQRISVSWLWDEGVGFESGGGGGGGGGGEGGREGGGGLAV